MRKISVKIIGIILLAAIMLTAFSSVLSAAETYEINGVVLPLKGYEDGMRLYNSTSFNCWHFAHLVYKAVWGIDYDAYQTSADNIMRDVEITSAARKCTAENLKKYLSAAHEGSVIRISETLSYISQRSESDNGHSLFFVKADDNGFVYYDITSGLGVRLRYASWSTYAGYSPNKYIKYIKCPEKSEAPSFDGDLPDLYELWRVNTEVGLNVRKEPSVSADKDGLLSNGTNIYVTDFSDAGGYIWGRTPAGWCALNYCEYVSGYIYTVTYDANGGVGAPDTVGNPFTTKLTVPETIPTNGTMSFCGWAVDKDAQVAEFNVGDTIDIHGNVVLYAIWKQASSDKSGDLDSNGFADIADALMLFKYVSGIAVISDEEILLRADVSADGQVDITDALLLFKTVSGT